MRYYVRFFMSFLLIGLLGCHITYSQEQKPSEIAYSEWKAKNHTNAAPKMQEPHIGIGLAVSKYMDVGMKADFSVFTGATEVFVPGLSFTAQPMGYLDSSNGKADLVDIGSSTVVNFKGSSNLVRNESGLIAQPELIGRVPTGTIAVRVTVSGFGNSDQQFSIVVPLNEKPYTAVLVNRSECTTSSNLTTCQWWTGNCPGQCP